jgi:DNA-directed RNA polymerase beta subunit
MSSLPQMPAGMLSGMPALKPAQPDEAPGRAIDDPALVRRAIFDKALLTVQELPPVTSSTHTLRLRNAAYEGPDNVGMREYKRALLSGDTLARRLRADVELVDNVSGNVLDARRTTLAAIPYYTDAGVFINKGTKYAMANQQRLRAGAYTRTRDNGEVETHINVPPGQGAPFRVFLDPATGVFKARVGQAQIPLVPMLQSLGVTEQDMRGAWGARLATANIAKVRGGDLNKLYTRLVRSGKSQTEPEQLAEIRQLLENTRLDPDVTRHTLNKPIERVDADALLTTTRKLLAIHNRKNPEMLKELGLEPADQDDRDHLAFMRLLGPEDITAERLRTAPKVLRPLLWKAGRTGKLDHMAPGALTRLVQDAILGSGLGQATEDINPLQVFEQQLRVTRMGVGGIPSDDSVPDSSRSVQPSHAGYIDPIVTPESGRAGIDVRLARLTRKGNDGELYSKFRDMRTGTDAWKQPKELFDSVIAFSTARPASPERPFNTADYVKFRNALDRGEIVRSESGKYFAQGMQRGQLDYYPIEQVDYAIPHMEDAFSPTANLVPGKSGMKGQRVAMGARMLTQALPLVDAEAPLVQSGVPGSSGSFEGLYGERMGALKAKQGGRVLGVSEDSITVQYDDGRKDEIELARHVPGARKTYTHQDPVVTPGARFEPGQLLARSNFTDKNGTAALGRNLRTAWMPLKGYNYEDAVVLSESGAKKLTSQHMYKTSVDIDKDTDKIGLAPYRGMFPKRFNAAQLEKVDEHGVVRVGQQVESGDPLVLMANERRGRVGEVSRAGSSRWRDAAETWEHDQPGIVTDVAKTKNGVVVAVKSIVPMQVGDKLSNRYGSKGVVAAILPDDEMPTNEAGEPIELAVNDLGITTRTNPVQVIEAVLGKIALKRGEPYHLHDFNDIADLRAFAMKEAERYGVKGAEDLLDPETGKAIPRVMTGQHFIMKLHHVAESKVSGRSFGAYTCFDSQTDVLTARGWVAWPDARDDDSFATLVDNELTYQRATQVTRAAFDGELCGFSGRYVDYLVTPNHRMWVRRTWRHNRPAPQFEFCDAAALPERKKGWVARQAGFVPDGGWFAETFTIPAAPRAAKHPRGYAKTHVLDSGDYAELVGWWLAEGSTTYNKRGREWCVGISQVEAANPDNFVRIGELLTRCGFNFTYAAPGARQRGRRGFRIRDKSLWWHLSAFGRGCQNKRIPRHLLDAAPPIRRRLFDALLAGDGSYAWTGPSWCGRYTTTSRGLADDVQELALRIGLGASVTYAREADPETNRRDVWVVGIFNTRKDAFIGTQPRSTAHFYTQPYRGTVYCATVPAGLLCVRRNGKTLITGNSDGTPAKGGPEGAKTWGMLHLNALLSHGAVDVAKDGHMVRGQRNPQYWAAVMAGKTPPDPEVPPVYRKFVAQLQSAGIHPVREGTRTHLMAMTNSTIKELAGDREVTSPDTVDWNDDGMKPIRGGLFDESLFGGIDGERWAKISLPEPLPNPVMEEPIRRVLGLTGPQFERIIAGQEQLNGATGSRAIAAALSNINVDAEIERAAREIRGTRKTARDAATRRVGFLLGARKTGVKPSDWMWDSVPVMPPRWRPVSRMQGTDAPMVADANYLYRDLFENKRNFEQLQGQVSDVGDERLALYQSMRAVTGLGDPAPEHLKEQKIKGAMQHIIGSSPKFGVVQRRLLGSQTDLVGRGTIVPNPDLDMDQVGIPEDQAWQVYRPFLVRHMAKRGVAPGRAAEMVANRTDIARRALTDVMSERPILLDRAPVLHRFGVMAFWPRIAKGNQIELTPIVTKGFGADFDGDAMQFHVPGSDKAVTDAVEKMMPSSNLRAPADFKVHQLPQQEYLAGLYRATHDRKNAEPIPFPTTKAMLAALSRGEISHDQPVVIEE